MQNVKYLARVFLHLLDYYHCYSFLVDNYLKKRNKKHFTFHYNRIKKSRLKKSQTKTFSSLVHLPLSLSLQFNTTLTTPLAIVASLPFPFHFPHSCSSPISSSLVHFLFFFASPTLQVKVFLGCDLATNSFGLGRLFYKSSHQLQNFRHHGD